MKKAVLWDTDSNLATTPITLATAAVAEPRNTRPDNLAHTEDRTTLELRSNQRVTVECYKERSMEGQLGRCDADLTRLLIAKANSHGERS